MAVEVRELVRSLRDGAPGKKRAIYKPHCI